MPIVLSFGAFFLFVRILILTPGFAANQDDTDCIPPLQRYVQALSARGHDVHVLALEYPFSNKPYPFFDARIYPCNGGNHWYTKLRTISRLARYTENICTYDKPDAIHSFWYGMAWSLGESISRSWKAPHICTLMGQETRFKSGSLLRKTTDQWQQMVCLSAWHQQRFAHITGQTDTPVIPWGMHEADIASPLDLAARNIDVLGVGSLLPVKNWERWLGIIARKVRERPDFKAVLAGQGPKRHALQTLARKLGISTNVDFVGALPRPRVLQYMKQSKVLLHTADFESFGYVLTEAAAQGCHVVSTPVGIAPQIADCGDTEDALALRLQWALERAPLKQADTPFLMEETVNAYEKLYASRVWKTI